jgi:hypothetical protein
VFQGISPSSQRPHKWREFDSAKTVGLSAKIPYASLHNGSHPNPISGGVMVESNRELDDSLQKLFLLSRRRAPDVFQNFVGFKKVPLVEKGYSTSEIVSRHALFCHRKQNLAPQREVWSTRQDLFPKNPIVGCRRHEEQQGHGEKSICS